MSIEAYTPKGDGGPAFPVPMVDMPNHGLHIGTTSGAETGMSLRDWFATHEQLAEWDDQQAIPSKEMCEALAGRPQPEHGWKCTTPKQWREMLRWEAEWRAALKYLRADAMINMRRL